MQSVPAATRGRVTNTQARCPLPKAMLGALLGPKPWAGGTQVWQEFASGGEEGEIQSQDCNSSPAGPKSSLPTSPSLPPVPLRFLSVSVEDKGFSTFRTR